MPLILPAYSRLLHSTHTLLLCLQPVMKSLCTAVWGLPGVAPNNGALAMLDLMVSVTLAPSSTAPTNSQIAAIMQACQILRAFEPTLVPKEFATSFAPIPAESQAQHTGVSLPLCSTYRPLFTPDWGHRPH